MKKNVVRTHEYEYVKSYNLQNTEYLQLQPMAWVSNICLYYKRGTVAEQRWDKTFYFLRAAQLRFDCCLQIKISVQLYT